METSYFDNPTKYNKLFWKYVDFRDKNDQHPEEIDSGFTPDTEYECLRYVLLKIRKNPREGAKIRIVIYIKDDESEVYIQEWYDTANPKGYVNVVHTKAQTEHRAAYNACVEYILKTN